MPEPGAQRFEYTDFERAVAMAIVEHPKYECFDIMLRQDVDGNETEDPDAQLTRADVVRIVLLEDKIQRKLNRKFFFDLVCRVMTRERVEFPDLKTVILDGFDSFTDANVKEFMKIWLPQQGYAADAFLWGPELVKLREEGA